MKLLAKTAEEWYQTAAGVARDLRDCLKERVGFLSKRQKLTGAIHGVSS